MARSIDMLFGAASSDEEENSDNSDSSGANAAEYRLAVAEDAAEFRAAEYRAAYEELMASNGSRLPSRASIVNLTSSPPRAAAAAVQTIAEDDDDDIQILSAAEAAAEVSAAARRLFADPSAASRKRKRPLVETKAEPTECTICCEACTIVGRHRLVALRCGHLFGKKCIERWTNEKRTCPNCSAAVRRTDIFPLFSDHVAVVDNSGLEDMTSKYEEEKKKSSRLEGEVATLKKLLEAKTKEATLSKQEVTIYKKGLVDANAKFELHVRNLATLRGQLRATTADSVAITSPASQVTGASANRTPPSSQAVVRITQSLTPSPSRTLLAEPQQIRRTQAPVVPSSQTSPQPIHDAFTATIRKYKRVFDVPLMSARVFSINRACNFVCVGEKLGEGSHGVLLLVAQDPRRRIQVPVHTSDVRDLAIHPTGRSVLTVAFDGKLAVTSIRDQKAVVQVELPPGRRQGWSCSFSESDPYAMFCGFQDGTVAKYDMRKPSGGDQGIVKNFSLPERQPVHSIKLFRNHEGPETQGLAAATFRGLSVWTDVSDVASSANGPVGNGSVAATPFSHVSSDQACFSLASNQLHPGQVVVSSRSTPTKHSVFDLRTIGAGQLTPRVEFTGHKASSVLSRSAMWSEADGTSVVASWSQDIERVMLWNVANHREARGPEPTSLSVASASMPVVDIQHVVTNGSWSSGGSALFGTMTSRQLCLYRSGG
ncbi:hypothetical protein PF005_g27032 [Phytophthora fragariae]|uniref:RING-type E3 ubiquitin transferase n=3 Tax=Phytophthora fragariae TaxID=53985 RepID=A0A6A3VVD2_9STRA|nr:hypothetical protein PF003_g27160 [Phytophthora fragariae]KAE8949690.1 hypothetical protein PF009_g808 [Phytophthora fragariae]KAE9083657.1 hypothetical protein PF006_g26643 [Phytophthora fragariae]KAE9131184.1 hypothetical protein PF007_g4250 [Phytophthora fragariae]KAE9171716.1 hypothetical protein PF005_g27032 [Phytophthora fragariae]